MRRRIVSLIVNSQLDIISERGQYQIGRIKFKDRASQNCCNIEANRYPIEMYLAYEIRLHYISSLSLMLVVAHTIASLRDKEREKWYF